LPTVKMTPKLITTITVNDGKYTRFFIYTDRDLTGVGRENTQTHTRVVVSYSDNFLKKMGLKASSMAGFENLKPVVIGGKDMLEHETCTINDAPAKVDPCPVD
jgi:hypothetical protein